MAKSREYRPAQPSMTYTPLGGVEPVLEKKELVSSDISKYFCKKAA